MRCMASVLFASTITVFSAAVVGSKRHQYTPIHCAWLGWGGAQDTCPSPQLHDMRVFAFLVLSCYTVGLVASDFINKDISRSLTARAYTSRETSTIIAECTAAAQAYKLTVRANDGGTFAHIAVAHDKVKLPVKQVSSTEYVGRAWILVACNMFTAT